MATMMLAACRAGRLTADLRCSTAASVEREDLGP